MGISYKNGFKTLKGTTQRPPEAMVAKHGGSLGDYVRGSAEAANPNFSAVNSVFTMNSDETNGSTIFTDDTGRHSITGNGTPLPSHSTSTAKFGGSSVTFSGGQYLDVSGNITDFDFGTTYTIETWFNTTDTGPNNILVAVMPASSHGVHMSNSNDGIRFEVYNGGSVDIQASSLGTSDGQWHHAAAVRDGDNYYVYVDGVQQGTASSTGSAWTSVATVAVGARIYQGTDQYHFTGQIDSVRISPDVVYSGPFTPVQF